MKKIASLFFLSLFIFVLNASGQTPARSQQGGIQPADDDSVVRITTNLIQVDAIVTDSKGRVVTNLAPEDFEVLVNGNSYKITHFSLVTVEPKTLEQPVSADANKSK